LRWREDADFYGEWALRQTWSPFQAACLLADACPPADGGSDFDNIEIEWDADVWEDDDATRDLYYEREEQIRKLDQIISANAAGKPGLNPVEITRWAVSKGLIHSQHPLARLLLAATDESVVSSAELENARARIANLEEQVRTLEKKCKETGKHKVEARAHILAVALKELARNREEVVDGGGRVVATKLADVVNDNRSEHGFERYRPANDTILKHIRDALGDKKEKSGH